MKKLTKQEKKVCKTLQEEIDDVIIKMLDLMSEVNRFEERLHFLREQKEQLFCPEDISPEGIAQNKKLLVALNQEQYGRGKLL